MGIDVEATCSYCGNGDLLCQNCDDIADFISDPPPRVTATSRVDLDPRVRADIITSKPGCRCEGFNGKWDMCDYHRGMADGIELIYRT